ncbi:DUF3040 domain-containing protein [Planobispora siamensis]|uniref:DUF3040 domain-containing protein n=1 Tax=Planobispora siamensis TaxID=936338 RepID=A0A8J3WQG3_9ACTN|nr:DUF3040 domain-containing protein [Planobispora siamensis]GIH95761.1 hypothetical protein Psi01_63910 [Planobispora siamensis]
MGLSRREAQILAEIEWMLQHQDRAFARRIDLLNAVQPGNAARPERDGRRFACRLSRKEIVWVIVATLAAALVPAFLTLALSASACGPQPSRPTAPPMAAATPAPSAWASCPP